MGWAEQPSGLRSSQLVSSTKAVERLLLCVVEPLDLIHRQLNLLARSLHVSQAASPLNPEPSWGAVLHGISCHQQSQSPLSTSAECRACEPDRTDTCMRSSMQG